jgi:hypothetical protein
MNCKQGTQIIIHQIVDLLYKIDRSSFEQPLALFNNSSIGQHFRHILDFYTCLEKGIHYSRIDYADRERDLQVEKDPLYAAASFEQVAAKILSLDEQSAIEVIADFSSELNETRPVVQSTIAREMMYAYDHAVHHLAMIKMGLKVSNPNVIIDDEVGVAPSTLKHWKESSRNLSRY